ncbi:CoA pyrophosphatase [Thalassotalea maritima]|uniref:CoA pyrophosphatase n=1 Tax=Thalassotalea maritima TaxID=3242416 RepID=UPI0035274D7D
MDKQQFLQKFSFQSLNKIDNAYEHAGHLRQASVLIPIAVTNSGLQVILTKRAAHLKHHPGQISFPGGKVEANDASPLATALREAHEEIGLAISDVDIIGQLQTHHVTTGYAISPFIGFIPDDYPFVVDPGEVAEVFQVPFEHFVNEDNHVSFYVQRANRTHNVHFMPYLHYNIWGATAAILKDLVTHLKR